MSPHPPAREEHYLGILAGLLRRPECLLLLIGAVSAVRAIAGEPVEAAVDQRTVSEDSSFVPEDATPRAAPVTVSFRGQPLFEIRAAYGQREPEARARAIEARLLVLAAGSEQVLDTMRVVEIDGASQLRAGDSVLANLTDADALRTGRTRQQLAADALLQVRRMLGREFADRSATALLRSSVKALLAAVILVAMLVLLSRVLRWFAHRLVRIARHWRRRARAGVSGVITPGLVTRGARLALRVLGLLLGAILIYLWLQYTLALFPWTRGMAERMIRSVATAVSRVGHSFIDYLPQLLQIIVIVVLARLLLRIVRLFFQQVDARRVHLRGFYPEWALPTYSLLRFIVIVIAAVMVFPYLPGSGSDGFKGISVFIGLLVSLGSASAIANVVAGLVLTYMRPFHVGDRVKIADAMGEVIAKDLFVVRLRTIKNVDITIPNSLVLANHIINFSSSARSRGLILNTTVTIGYETPWLRVHELLIGAARDTPLIDPEPAPFVLQTALNDSSVSYEINAATRVPQQMAQIYSDLRARIQTAFHAAGIEMMSPQYMAVRDGNAAVIPQEHLPRDYRRPQFGFRLFTEPKEHRPDDGARQD